MCIRDTAHSPAFPLDQASSGSFLRIRAAGARLAHNQNVTGSSPVSATMTTKLTEKQRRFVEAYMGQAAGNATEAARLAGYKGNDITLGAVGAENLKKPQIIEALKERVDDCPLIMSRKELQEFWTRVAKGEELDGKDLPVMRDRLKASEMLGKSQAVFVDKVEHSGTVESKVQLYIPDNGRTPKGE
jgi:phage terminase small subunit